MEFVIYVLKNISLTYFKPGKQRSKLRLNRNQYVQNNLNLSRWLAIPRQNNSTSELRSIHKQKSQKKANSSWSFLKQRGWTSSWGSKRTTEDHFGWKSWLWRVFHPHTHPRIFWEPLKRPATSPDEVWASKRCHVVRVRGHLQGTKKGTVSLSPPKGLKVLPGAKRPINHHHHR